MEIKREISDNSFTPVMVLTQNCQQNIPERYVLPPFKRPNSSHVDHISTNHPVIDLSKMNHPAHRSQLINEVHAACNQLGYFQVINHGIPTLVMKDALQSAEEFFNLPRDEHMSFASTDVHEPVRYGTSVNHGMDKEFYWRDFIKLYANPISDWIHLWPSNPPNDDIEEGSQVMTVNCYPSCPEPHLALGMPPHTDFGTITILNQSQQGLEIMNHDKKWNPVPFIQDALIVQLGDQLEVISNGRYKSVPHRAILNVQRKRFSIASLHGMHIEKKVGPGSCDAL